MDIHRERSRGANRVEDIELYASSVEQELVSFEDTPEIAIESGEKRIVKCPFFVSLNSSLNQCLVIP